MKKLTNEEFIQKATKIHGNKYDYSTSLYIGSKIPISIKCNKCNNVFLQRPNDHLTKHGCSICTTVKRKTTSSFIIAANLIHENFYDYSLVNYINDSTKIEIICKLHGSFKQSPNRHLQGNGCYFCGLEQIKLKKSSCIEEFIISATKIHNNLYDYSKSIYKGVHVKIEIFCKKCNKCFKQSAGGHLNGNGCPKCCNNSTVSKPETKWLDSLNIPENNRQIWLRLNNKKYKVDGFNPETNTVYEFLGDYWHGNINSKKYKYLKSNDIHPKTKKTYGELHQETMNRIKLFQENGYEVIYIWESDWKKQERKLLDV